MEDGIVEDGMVDDVIVVFEDGEDEEEIVLFVGLLVWFWL